VKYKIDMVVLGAVIGSVHSLKAINIYNIHCIPQNIQELIVLPSQKFYQI